MNVSVLKHYYKLDYDPEVSDNVETITGLRIVHATKECTYSDDFAKTVGTVVFDHADYIEPAGNDFANERPACETSPFIKNI